MSSKEVYFEGPPPWGFRMTGGVDTGHSLRISRVNPGSRAEAKGIREGDLISSINGQSTKCLTNSESHALLRSIKENLHLGLNEDKTSSPRRRSKEMKLTPTNTTAGDNGDSSVESKIKTRRKQNKTKHSKKRTFKSAIKSILGYRETTGQVINLNPQIPVRKSEECDSIGATTLPDDNTSQVFYDNVRDERVNGEPSDNGSTHWNPSSVSKNSDCSEVIRILEKAAENHAELSTDVRATPTPSPVKTKTVTFGRSEICEASIHRDADPCTLEEHEPKLIECKAIEIVEFPVAEECTVEHLSDTPKPSAEIVDIHWPSFIKVLAPPAIHSDSDLLKQNQPVFISPRRYLEAISEESSDFSDSSKPRESQFAKPIKQFDGIPEDCHGSKGGIDTSWQEGKSLEEVSDVPIVSDSHSDSDVLNEETSTIKLHSTYKPMKKPHQRSPILPSNSVVKNVVSSYYNNVKSFSSPVHLETVQQDLPLSGPISEVVEIVYIDSSDSEATSKSEADYCLSSPSSLLCKDFNEDDAEFGDGFLEKIFEITGEIKEPFDNRSIPESTVSSSSRVSSKLSAIAPLTLRELGVCAVVKMPNGASVLKELGLEYIDTDQYSGYMAECSENSCSSVQFNSEKEQDCDISERDMVFDHFSGDFPWLEEFKYPGDRVTDEREEAQPSKSSNDSSTDDSSFKMNQEISELLDLHNKFAERRGYFEPENLKKEENDVVDIEFIEELEASTALKKYHEMRQEKMKQTHDFDTEKQSLRDNVSLNESIKDELKRDDDELVGNSRLLGLIQSIEGKSSSGESAMNGSYSGEPIYVNVKNNFPVVFLDNLIVPTELKRRHSHENIDSHVDPRLSRPDRPKSLPPPGEVLRRRMYDEYMDKLAALSERRQLKVVKLSKCPQDVVVNQGMGSLEKEFMGKVKERNLKLGLENDDSEEEGKIDERATLPRHIQELMDRSDECDIIGKQGLLIEIDQALSPERKGFLTFGKGIWSPAQTPEAERKRISFADIEIEEKENESQEPQPPIWTPKNVPSPTLERKFRSVNFQSPPPKRKEYQPSSEEKPELPKDLPIEINRPSKLSLSASENSSLSSSLRLPPAQNPTITLLQKAREGEIPKGARYLEDSPDKPHTVVSPNEIIYSVKKEYSTADEEGVKKVVELTPRKFTGIGPTTKEGIPIGLRSEVKEDNQQRWYKRMYDSLHKADHDKDYVTVRYKTKRKGQYPYSYAGGYASEPERLNYDSDASLSKYATLDRRKIRNKESDFTSSTLPRNKYGPDVKHAVNVYRNQPGRIENYEPGHSSISDVEKKQWWDEVLDIFNGEVNQQGKNSHVQDYRSSVYTHKDAGYDSDSTLVFKRRDDMSQTLSPAEQKMAYKVIQRGGEVPLHGLRKTMPDRPKEDSEIEYFPLSPTLTRIRVHKKSPKPTEKVFYPVTPVEPVFGAYKRLTRSSTVPSPPRRDSSRNISSLKLYTKIASSTSQRSPLGKLASKSSSSVKDMGHTSSKERALTKKSPSTLIPSTSKTKKEVLRKSPELKAPSEVKKALKDSKGSSGTVLKSSTTLYSSAGFSKSPCEDKSVKVTVAISSKGKDATRSSSSASSKTDSRKPSPILSKSATSVLKPRLTDSTLSLVKSSRPSSRASTTSTTIVAEPPEKKKLKSGNGEPKKKKKMENPGKSENKKDEEKKKLKKKTECLKKKVTSKKQDKENIPERTVLSEEESTKMSDSNVKSESFFQHLLLKRAHSPDSTTSAAYHSPPITERAKKFIEPEHFCYRSEPSLCHLNVYLSQRKPVTESRFRSLERQDRSRRALSPFFGTPAFYEKLDKFDACNNVWDRTQSFRDTPTYESIKGRSSSEPPTGSSCQELDPSPTVSRSPSRRRIRRSTSRTVESVAGVKRKFRSKSLNEADRSPNLGSCSSLSQSTDYRSYVFDMIHSTRKSDRFKELHRFYSSLERMAELEKTTSNCDLRPRLKGEEVIDFDRWKQLRTKERAEIELNNLYQKLIEEQKEKDLLFLPKETARWHGDIGLRSKEKSVEDLRVKFQKMVESSATVKEPISRDVYKPLWRGNSVVNLAHSLTTITGSRRGRPVCDSKDDRAFHRPFNSSEKREIGSKLWSSLSMDQVNALKTQLTEIYTTVSNLKRERIDKIKQNIEEYEMNVADLKSPDSLHVRSNSLLSPEQLYSPSVRKKFLRRQECLKADSIASIPQWKAQKPLTEPEKKKLSMSLSAEVKERIKRKKHGSIVIPRETLGAVAAIKGTKKMKSSSTSETSPRTCYSFMDEDSSGKNSSGNKDFLLVLTPKDKQSDVKKVVDDWGGKECAKMVLTTSSSSSSASTVIHLGSKEDCKQVDKVSEILPEKEKNVDSGAVSPHGNLYSSQSYTDLKELFGEKQATTYATLPLKGSKKSIFSSVDSLCKSASPDPVRYYRAYLNLVKSGDVRKLREKFESYDDIYNLRKSTPIQKSFQSDPDLTRDFLSRKGGELSKVVVKGQELGDVQWLRKKFEPRKVSPVPFRVEDRYMPHINIISKTASLQQRPRTPSQQHFDSVTRTGYVDRLKQHFELKGMSILGQMYTSTPEITELHDIAPYLECDWVAHRNPRSPKPIRKGELVKKRPSSESPIRQSILKNADIFANQPFNPEIHRPLYRYQPEMDHDTPRGWHSRQWSSPRPTVTFREPIGKSLSGRPSYSRHQYQESPHRYVESEVNIHYKTPVRNESKVAWPEEELAEKQAEIMRRIYQEQRRTKYLNELHDMYSRRHTDNFIPSQKSPIPLNRYDDFPLEPQPPRPRDRTPEPKLVARAMYNFVGQSPKELSFRKGDIIYVRRQIDKNWYEGEHNAMIGLFPFNYVEIVPYDGIRSLPRKASEGQARAKFNFQAQTHLELSLVKGELVLLTRRVDENWFEGRIGNRKGIFPVSYVEVLVEPGERALSPSGPVSSKPIVAPASHSVMLNGAKDLGHQHYQPPRPALYSSSSLPSQSRVRDVSMMSQSLHIETQSDPIPYRVLYNYRPQNDDELELKEGDVVYVMEKCDDGWYVGSLHRNGQFGTFPGNYVERITP